MAETSGQEKTEPATPKKRQDARKKGQVAQSREISSAMILMVSLGFFYFAGSWMFLNLSELITGARPVLDLSIFSPERILENKPVFEDELKLV